MHFIGDRYDVHPHESLKSEERTKRCSHKQSKDYIVDSKANIPEWKGFIDSSKNKQSLLIFLASSWSEKCDQHPQALQLYLGGGISDDACDSWLLAQGKKCRIQELCCHPHEEADTRLGHLAFSTQTLDCPHVVVESADTYVLLLYSACTTSLVWKHCKSCSFTTIINTYTSMLLWKICHVSLELEFQRESLLQAC